MVDYFEMPELNYAILAVNVTNVPPGGAGISVPPTLSISVDGTEGNYQFIGKGFDKVMLYINKPANSEHVQVIIRLKSPQNAGATDLYINRIERYTSILSRLPGDWETL